MSCDPDGRPGAVCLHVHALHRLGEAQLGAGDRTGAARSLATARETGVRVGTDGLVRAVDELARRARLPRRGGSWVIDPEGQGAAPAPGIVPGEAPLTPREREVLELVAQGLSNRQIGEALFISGKTVSVHVSAILRKVGATSRAQAAGLASTVLGQEAGRADPEAPRDRLSHGTASRRWVIRPIRRGP